MPLRRDAIHEMWLKKAIKEKKLKSKQSGAGFYKAWQRNKVEISLSWYLSSVFQYWQWFDIKNIGKFEKFLA